MYRCPPTWLPKRVARPLAWLCLFLTLWPAFGQAATSPAPAAVPVVSNVAGAVSVRGRDGVSRDVLSSRIIHSGDTLITGVDSLAVVSLADIGSVRLGPASTASASITATRLLVRISAGSACAQALSKGVGIEAGALALAADDDSAIFSLVRNSDTTTIAVYQGQISATLTGKKVGTNPTVLKAGDAAVSSHDGMPVQVPIQTVQQDFAALKCPDDAIIARAVPSAEPSPQAGGHGGGAGGLVGILLGLGALAALAGGHSGGGGGTPSPTPTPTAGPGQLTVNPPSLSFLVGGAPQSFTASESKYAGNINAASGNPLVATVAPASASGTAPVTFTVTPVGPGSTSITVTDDHGGSQSVSITVTPPGTLSAAPSSLAFLVAGAPQPFTASETSYTGAINAVSEDTSIATVSPASGPGTAPVIFTVTPQGPGTTKIDVSDDHGGMQKVSITVTPPGSLSVSPGNLAFLLSGASQPFTARESAYTGPINAASSDTSVATVAPASGTSPATFTVTPVGSGTTNIVVTDDHGGSQSVGITVIGLLTTSTNNITFLGSTAPKRFTATDPFYVGIISASIDHPSVATVAPEGSSIGPGPVTFKVTPVAAGNATVTVSDTLGGSNTVSVVVNTGALSINPNALTFTVGGATQTFTGSEADYSGPISAVSSSTGKATVTPASGAGPGPVVFTVTAISAGNPTIAVTDDHGGGPLFVDVTITGPLTPTPGSLTFDGTTAAQAININDPNYFGSISASSTDVSVATVTSPGVGPSASFSVTPVNMGTATINFSDANLGTTSVGVTVNPGPLAVSTSSISLTGAGATRTFNASETLYKGSISASSGATSVATVSPASGTGPTPAPFTVTAVGPGATTVTVTDDHGGSKPISVNVSETPSVAPGSLSFGNTSGGSQSVSISEPNYHGAFSIVGNTCSSLASVGPVSGSGPSASVPVTALNTTASGGTCQFKIQDSFGSASSPVSVTVGPFGAINLSQTTFTFTDLGAGAAQSFNASESGYTGSLAIDASACSGIATVSPGSGISGTSFTITPVAAGGPCSIHASDDHTQTASASVTVGPFGTITPSTTSLTFSDVGSGANMTFSVSESGYTGNFAVDQSACAGIATVNPLSGNGSVFTVTPVAAGGPCNLNITDDHTSTAATLSVTVGPFGAIVPSATNIPLTIGGASGTFTVSESGYSGLFTLDSSTCSSKSIATESPGSGTSATTFTVTPGSVVGNCKIVVSDDHGGSQSVVVSVTSGTLTVSPPTLGFAGTGSSPLTFAASDPSASTFSATSSDTTVATVAPASQLGPSPVTFTVSTSTNTGTASITVTDDVGGTAVVSVGVGVSPLLKKHHPGNLHKPVPHKPGSHNPPSRAPRPSRFPIGPGVPRRPVFEGGNAPIIHPSLPPSVGPALPPRVGAPPVTQPLNISVANMMLATGAQGQEVVISESGYSRLFTVSSSDAAVATVSTPAVAGPVATIIIAAHNPGVAIVRIADDHGGVRTIAITVRAPQLRSPHFPLPTRRT